MLKQVTSWMMVVVMLLSGCAVNGTKGTKTTNYDTKGRVVSVGEDTMLGDTPTEIYSAIKVVAKATAENIKYRVDAIKDAVKTETGDSPDARAWKKAFGAFAIASIPDTTAQNIKAIPVLKTGWDVSDSFIKAGKEVLTTFIPYTAVAYMAKKFSENGGDRTEVQAAEGSYVNLNQRKTTQNTTNITTGGDGEGATASNTYTPSATTGDPSTEITNEAAPVAETPVAAKE